MWRWLESTFKLQTETYGYPIGDYAERVMRSQEPGWVEPASMLREVTEHIDWNQTAAVQELAELREEFSWKPWATDRPFVNRERVIDEIVDTKHFLANILIAVGCTDEEFEAAYQRKQKKNRERAASGTYSARKGGLAEGSDA